MASQETDKPEYEPQTDECWNCGGEGFSYHDCGEDTCCCLYPEPNVLCDICWGKGYLVIEEEK